MLSLVRISLVALVFFTSESVCADDARIGAMSTNLCPQAAAQAALHPVAPILPDSGMKSDANREKRDVSSAPGSDDAGCGPGDESQPLASLILMSADRNANEKSGNSKSENKASEHEEETDDSGIPGAVVAVIFGVFGLLVIARRNLR